MKFWILKKTKAGNLVSPEYDTTDAVVVRANTARRARMLALTVQGDEGAIWTDPNLTSCRSLKLHGPEKVIIESFWQG